MKKQLWMKPFYLPQCGNIVLYRCIFTTEKRTVINLRFSADEHAQIFLDDQYLAEGPEKGCTEYWYYRDLSFTVEAGTHTFMARVSSFPGDWKYSYMSIRHGFYCEDYSGLLNNWECRLEQGVFWDRPFPDWAAGPRVIVNKKYGTGLWESVVYFEDDRVLHAPDLPPMRYEKVEPKEIKKGLYYFTHYTCSYSVWHFKGQGCVKVRWSETPYLTDEFDPYMLHGKKGNRDGSFFVGTYDTFFVDGSLDWRDYQWRAGHYVEVEVTGDVTYDVEFYETGYPLPEYKGDSKLIRAAVETLRACAHDTFMDCPFYERLLYAGDSRLEALALYHITDDHRLAAKTLRMFLASQKPDGSIRTQYPSKLVQIIPSYMPIFVLSFHDYWKRHKDDSLLVELMPKFQKLIDYLISNITENGLELPGWQFLDWCTGWDNGVPPGNCGVSLFGVLALNSAAEILQNQEIAQKAKDLLDLIVEKYYVPEKQLFADDLQHQFFSEHVQSLAIIAGLTDVKLDTPNLTPCSIYFSYYYLIACSMTKQDNLLNQRLKKWSDALEEGLTTFPEEFGTTRSDCHAWGSYILLFLKEAENLKQTMQ